MFFEVLFFKVYYVGQQLPAGQFEEQIKTVFFEKVLFKSVFFKCCFKVYYVGQQLPGGQLEEQIQGLANTNILHC